MSQHDPTRPPAGPHPGASPQPTGQRSAPVIGITPDTGESSARPGRPPLPRYELKRAYCEAVLAAGGLPLIVPYVDQLDQLSALLSLCDGLLVTGGAFDIPPEAYGERARVRLEPLKPERTNFEQSLLRLALARQLPMLGICGGMQLLAVELGGSLFQDIAAEVPGALEHEQPDDPREAAHPVRLEERSLLRTLVAVPTLQVNSTHHQAVRSPGRARVTALAPDGVIEAIEGPGPFTLGVEWHPELLAAPEQQAIYRGLIDAARANGATLASGRGARS